jgi:sulfur transfer protein SufE
LYQDKSGIKSLKKIISQLKQRFHSAFQKKRQENYIQLAKKVKPCTKAETYSKAKPMHQCQIMQ